MVYRRITAPTGDERGVLQTENQVYLPRGGAALSLGGHENSWIPRVRDCSCHGCFGCRYVAAEGAANDGRAGEGTVGELRENLAHARTMGSTREAYSGVHFARGAPDAFARAL